MNKRRYRQGMDAERIVRAAMTLTRRQGLGDWSLRQLTTRLDTSPSVVFHHVGDRAALSEAVVSKLSEDFRSPGPDCEWSEWVRLIALPLRAALLRWPGVAEWLLIHGPVFPHMMPVLEEGLEVFRRAGFGDEAPLAYSTLYTAIIGSIAQSQMRQAATMGGIGAHEALSRRFESMEAGTGARAMQESLKPYFTDTDAAGDPREFAYHYLVDRLIDGIRAKHEAD